jgi:hypothetical protein
MRRIEEPVRQLAGWIKHGKLADSPTVLLAASGRLTAKHPPSPASGTASGDLARYLFRSCVRTFYKGYNLILHQKLMIEFFEAAFRS